MPGESSSAPNPSPDSESLVKRLAGPSTNKAGLAKDQTEINRIIAEASKGSKFYENEKRKDKDLTDRIARMLQHRDEALRGADIRKAEQAVDQLLVKLEAQRDLSQIVVHVDMDAFYANVELLDNPDLRGKAFGVGHGVLTTASYEARNYGVRSGMAGFIAKKLCPELILVQNHFERYTEMSKQVMDIFRRYDPTMCPAGCDEGYLNITAYCKEHQLTAEECVQQMRATVFEESKLTVSAGIAPNKMLAKICSDKNKPNGLFALDFTPQAIRTFMRGLSIRKVPGVGRVNERLLESIGIKTCGDIYVHRAVLSLMDKQFGLHFLLQTYLGIASNVVQPGQREERKSIGAERTFNPIRSQDQILRKLEEVAAELEEDMTRSGWTGKTVTLKFKLDTYQVFTRAKSSGRWISTRKEDLYAVGKELLMPELPLTLRLIGLRVTKLKDLRADSDAKAGGIKRFLEPVNAASSPGKKRRIEADDGEGLPRLQDAYEDAMPGFHEDAELDGEGVVVLDVTGTEHEEDPCEAPGSPRRVDRARPAEVPRKPRPPASAPAPSGPTSKPLEPLAAASKKPHSAVQALSSGSAARPAAVCTQTCPVCGKVLETDNEGLNAHVDFCLSKGAIMEAQAAASVSRSAKGTSAWGQDGRRGRRK